MNILSYLGASLIDLHRCDRIVDSSLRSDLRGHLNRCTSGRTDIRTIQGLHTGGGRR